MRYHENDRKLKDISQEYRLKTGKLCEDLIIDLRVYLKYYYQ